MSSNNTNNNNTMSAGNKASDNQDSGNAIGQTGSNATGQGGVPSRNAGGGRPQVGAGGRGRQGSSHATDSNQPPLGQGQNQAFTIRPRGGGSGRGSLHSAQSGRIQKSMGTVKFASHDKNPKDIDPNYEVVKKAPKLETFEGRNVAIIHDKAIQASGDPDALGGAAKMNLDEVATLLQLGPGQVRCANCREVGHELQDCVRPSTYEWHKPKFAGGIRGCPTCNALHSIDTCARFKALSVVERAYVMVERRQGKPQIWTRHCIYGDGVLDILKNRTDIVPPLTITWVLENRHQVETTPYDYSLPKKTPFLKDECASSMANVAWMKVEAKQFFGILHPELAQALHNELKRALARRAAAFAARLLEEEALKKA
ncbi:hypothetical protein MCOR34_011505 [Pyricularia oryzae]|nr:hypothetical protein MCOR34_011505 [Pyricularia oryzae]KAI6445294.1 hypothetical protein MCOR17_010997 [Pyricularia oryzae]KAI6479127.1 hypothetical protein MCOR13_011541 [Pyricularia oryzae]KAI6551138.1 hypothetical protein MCOR04_011123 [Pyricularia oryzae]